MAELRMIHVVAVFTVASDKLLTALGDAAVIMPENLRRDLEHIKDLLAILKAFLDDAERRTTDVGAMMPIEDVAYDVWDVVNEIQANKGAIPMAGVCLPLHAIVPRTTIANKVNKIKRKLSDIHKGLPQMSFISTQGELFRTPETISYSYRVEGRDKEIQRMLDLLLSLAASDMRDDSFAILPIFGLAGVGKTALAQRVFHDTRLMSADFARVWVSVSMNFDLERIVISIIEGLTGQPYVRSKKTGQPYDAHLGTFENTSRRLNQLLGGGKKILIVLDDIWEQSGDNLEELKHMLDPCNQESKVTVIVTTRDEGIARSICTNKVEPYKLHPLSDDHCWEIIKKTSMFEYREDKQELDKIGREIAAKCGGLPLVSKTVGGMLRAQGSSIDQWSAVRSSDFSCDPSSRYEESSPLNIVLNMLFSSLELSYHSMPPELKLCFASLGALADSHNMTKDDLIHRWIALDLIDPYAEASTSTRHKNGDHIISRLLEISFLDRANLASSSGRDDNSATLFTMNRLVHSFARSASNSMFTVVDGGNQKHCRYAVLTNSDIRSKLSSILPAELRALRLMDCSKMELSSDSFSFAKNLRILELRESNMQKLPDSICELWLLVYLNLSGCSGLKYLPGSFGSLTNVVHINLSGCSGLKCLPESFGNLTNVVHINLSGCHGLVDLPKSVLKLNKLEHLDLSFCSCLGGLPTTLGGLTNLQYLNLSHPCCYAVEHKDHLEQLINGAWAKLTRLKYLNLSMYMNPIFWYLPEGNNLDCSQCIQGLSSLEHLDLSHNIFLVNLLREESTALGGLTRLQTLDLSGCIRLKSIDKRILEPVSLKLVLRKCLSLEYSFEVRADDGTHSSNVVQLEDVSCKELEISCLEKVRSLEEANRIGLDKKQKLEKLTLGWTKGYQGPPVDGEKLLENLLPPQNLHHFALHGYRAERLPDWLRTNKCTTYLRNLVELTMEDVPSCSALPPFLLLPNLKQVVLRRMASITRIDAGELSGSTGAAFERLLQFTLDDLENLEEFATMCRSGSSEEYILFPIIDELVMQNCPNVKVGPYLPIGQSLQVSPCERVISSLPKRGEAGGQRQGLEASSSSTSASSARATRVVVKNCKVPLGDWSLLHHLPNLHRLEIWNSNDLSGSAETICQVLSPLKSLGFYQCDGMTSLPEYLDGLTSLQELIIDGCRDINTLPLSSIDKLRNLKDLRILGCQELKRWCQLQENKEKLFAHIQELISYEEYPTIEPDTTAHHTRDKQLPLGESSSLSVTLH